MKVTLIPKRKITVEESESVLLASALSYMQQVVESRLSGVSAPIDLTAHAADATTHGATGAVMGTTNAQTATNKTFTTPVVASLYQDAGKTKLATFQAVTGTVALSADITTHANLTATHGATGAVVGTTNAQELTSKTLNASVAKGTWTTSGTWGIPAFTLGGSITCANQIITGCGQIQLIATRWVNCAVDNSYIYFSGGTDGHSAVFLNFGKSAAAPNTGSFWLQTPNAALTATRRLFMTGGVDTAVANWEAITHTNIKLTGAANAFGAYVLATGTGKTVDNVITALQALGLVTQA